MRRIGTTWAAAALALALSGMAGRGLVRAAVPPSPDAFDHLQQNAWYLPTADDGARLYVTSLGTGPVVVVLHGGPGNDFQYLVSAVRGMADRRTFVLFDQRGSLLSPVAPDQVSRLTLAVLVEDLETLRVALGRETLTLFGHSFGTMLALSYYQAHPDRVAGLVLTAAAPPATPPGQTFLDVIRAARPRMDALRRRPAVQAALREAGLLSDRLTPQQQFARQRIERDASINLYQVDRWRQFQGGGIYYNARVDDAVGDSVPTTYDIRPTFARHPVPITVVQGEYDYLDPAGRGWEALARTEPLVRLGVLHNAGHYAWLDDPVGFRRHAAAGFDRSTGTHADK